LPFVKLSESGASSIGNIVPWAGLDPRDAGAAACVRDRVRAAAFEFDTVTPFTAMKECALVIMKCARW